MKTAQHHLPLSGRGLGRSGYEITGCTLVVQSKYYEWVPAKFDVISDWNDSSADNAIVRTIDGHTSSKEAVAQVQRRLKYCLTHHDRCKASSNNTRPLRFLSVSSVSGDNDYIKVVRAETLHNRDTEPYTALSYCWGQEQIFKTTQANKVDVETTGILVSLLPKSIKDAIQLVRELGIKLLWVDSLCLVQDDKDELAKEISKMHHYYSNSVITISAATASSCSQGFLCDTPMPYTSENDVQGPFYFPLDYEALKKPPLRKLSSWMTRNLWSGSTSWLRSLSWLKLVIRSSPPEVIDSRAWTMQEGLLSLRLVSFGSRVIRWSCQTESYGTEQYSHLRDSWRASRRQSSTSHLKLWCTLVEGYTQRALSDEQDRLAAISGIASILCHSDSARKDFVNYEWPAVSSTPSEDTHASGQHLPISSGQGPDNFPVPLKSPPSGTVLRSSTSAEMLRPLAQGQYAAGLLDAPYSMDEDEMRRSANRLRMMQFTLGHDSRLLILQLLWTPRSTASRTQVQIDSSSSYYVAPTWSWAGHGGAIDTHIIHIDDTLLNLIRYQILMAGFRVLEVKTVPRNPEAPYGSLDSASLTVESTVLTLSAKDHSHIRLVFDTVGQDANNRKAGGLMCLQIIPDLHGLEMNELSQLHRVPHGLLLEPVEPGGQSRTDRFYRRVGVYYKLSFNFSPEEQRPEVFKTLTRHGGANLMAGLHEGKRERITIV